MRFNSENLVGMIPSDITVVVEGGSVYSGTFDRSKADFTRDLREQPIWQIRKTAVAEGDGLSVYETLYPEGSKNFSFVWSEMLDYEYAFSKN